MQIIFIVPSISDSHYRNRIIEFIDKGYTVNVYGFERKNSNKKPNLPYNISILGSIADKNYTLANVPVGMGKSNLSICNYDFKAKNFNVVLATSIKKHINFNSPYSGISKYKSIFLSLMNIIISSCQNS